jgi:hypothetical protein
VFGNVHVSSLGAPILEHFPEIDWLVIGEGEGALLDLADGKPLNEIGNLIWRDDAGRIVVNPRRDRILDLDELPFPAYEKLAGFPHAYHLPLFAYEKRHGATMITSRGCPYTCSFCDRTVFERLYKTNSAQYTYDHMKYLRDNFGVYHINMYDDLFTAKKQRVMDLCDLLIEQPLGVQFNCAIRTGHTSDEMLAKLKQAGALMVSMGIESADPAMMERHKAGVTLDAVRDTVRQIHAAGLRATGLFILACPADAETVRTTRDVSCPRFDEMNMTKFSPRTARRSGTNACRRPAVRCRGLAADELPEFRLSAEVSARARRWSAVQLACQALLRQQGLPPAFREAPVAAPLEPVACGQEPAADDRRGALFQRQPGGDRAGPPRFRAAPAPAGRPEAAAVDRTADRQPGVDVAGADDPAPGDEIDHSDGLRRGGLPPPDPAVGRL